MHDDFCCMDHFNKQHKNTIEYMETKYLFSYEKKNIARFQIFLNKSIDWQPNLFKLLWNCSFLSS